MEKVSLAMVTDSEQRQQRRDNTKTSGKLDYDFQGCSEEQESVDYNQWLPAPGCDRVPPLTSRVASTQSLRNSGSTKKSLGQNPEAHIVFVVESHRYELELSAMLWLKSEVAKEINIAPIRKLVAWLILFSL